MAGLYHALLLERGALQSSRLELTAAVEGRLDAVPADATPATRAAASLTDDERTRLDQIDARLAQLDRDLAREEAARQADIAGPAALAPFAPLPGGFARSRDLAAGEPWGNRTGSPLGEYLQAVHRATVGGGVDPRLTYQAIAQGAGAAVGADGGYLVGKTMTDAIVLRMNTGGVYSRATRIGLDPGTDGVEINVIDETSRVTGSRFGGVTGYWVDEGTAPTATRPRFNKVALKLRGLAALGYATNQLLRNAAALQSVFERAFAEELRWLTENAFIRGTGAGQPLGILNSAALVTVTVETGQTAADGIVYENITNMVGRLHADSAAGSVWFINQDALTSLYKMSLVIGSGGVPVFMPPGGASAPPFGTLMGRPIVPVEYCSTLNTVGDIILANMGEYAYIDGGAPEQAASMHVAFVTNEMAFRCTYEVDGQSMWRTALTPANGTATLSPFVALATRT